MLKAPGTRRDLLDISTRVCLNDLALIMQVRSAAIGRVGIRPA